MIVPMITQRFKGRTKTRIYEKFQKKQHNYTTSTLIHLHNSHSQRQSHTHTQTYTQTHEMATTILFVFPILKCGLFQQKAHYSESNIRDIRNRMQWNQPDDTNGKPKNREREITQDNTFVKIVVQYKLNLLGSVRIIQ